MAKVGDVIIERLIAAGVKRVYGLCGDSLNGLTDAIRKSKKIEWIAVRHEETAAFAAGAEAHLTGTIAVCTGSSGPGNLHLINGLYDCYRNRVPVLAIAAHIPSTEIGLGYFQETNPQKIFAECTRYCELVTDPKQVPHILEIAIQSALATSSVSMVIIPGDTMIAQVEASSSVRKYATEEIALPKEEEIEKAADLLNSSERIAILGGAGCIHAHKELIETAKKLQSPIVHTLRGKEYIEHDNPFSVGMTGLIGFASGYHAMKDADVLLILGADFPYRQFFPENAQIIQVDKRGENIGKRCPVHHPLIGDVKQTLLQLMPKLQPKKNGAFLSKALDHYRKSRERLDDLATGGKSKPIHPQYVAKLVSDLASEDAVFTCDVGTPTVWAARYLQMNGKRALLGSFNHGTMANALPQAIGAQTAFPKRQVISLSGDGGLSMLLGELTMLRQTKAPVKIVVFNNGAYGFVELEMKAAGILEFGTEMNSPDFAKVAQSMDLFGIRVETPDQLSDALKQAFSHKGPALVDVVVNRQELSMPPTIGLEQAIGFNIWMLRAILDGQGSKILEVATTNLFR
jgi:pyruvate dehydrogenase (quinone)